jgi:hypothetical protein
MESYLEELQNSWAHCTELLKSQSSFDLAIVYLEDFKEQFSRCYTAMKSRVEKKYQQIAFSLLDSAFLFWKKKGTISELMSSLKKSSYKDIQKRVEQIDSIMKVFTSQVKIVSQ